MKTSALKNQVEKAKSIYTRYEPYWPAIFFVAGFLFDVLTLDRIDSLFSIVQQAIYLFLLSGMLTQLFVETELQRPLSPRWRHYVRWRIEAIHFLFGSLLSTYTLFYLKSASLATAFAFLLFMAFLLVVNELPRFHVLGLGFKFALLALCWMSYSAYLVPTLLGQTGMMVFLFSLFVGLAPVTLLSWIAKRKQVPSLKRQVQIFRPSALVLLTFLIFYFFRLIPPVPLSIQYMGVYHKVEKTTDGQFALAHERPWWRFWHNGDQQFLAQPEDRIVVFFRLFSPTRFKDQVRLTWYLKDQRFGWTKQDSIPIQIVGGRDQGFRGYGEKRNYTVGEWRAAVETSDGREIGRIHFTVATAPSSPRTFHLDHH